ncbi:MAG: GerMN domain-containing protein [Acidimicrobiia bacterium]|nr:GerMN domain-containing protein [Acidimicrobiia bacterium]
MSGRLSLAVRAQVLTLALLALAGCAIAVDSAPHPVANVPDDLFSTTSSTIVPAKAANRLFLYFVNASNNLVRVELPRDTPATPQEAIDALVAPSQEVLTAGLTTRLPSLGFTAEQQISEEGVLTVTVTGPELRTTANADPPKVAKIYAQIVCTVSELSAGATAVEIKDEEGQIPVLLPEAATPETHPVTRANFANCVTDPTPPALVPTTTTRPTTTTSIRRLDPPSTEATTVPDTDTAVIP